MISCRRQYSEREPPRQRLPPLAPALDLAGPLRPSLVFRAHLLALSLVTAGKVCNGHLISAHFCPDLAQSRLSAGERSCGVRNRRFVRGSRSRAALSLALGIAFAGLVALGLATWLYAAPASAATTTTAPPAATSACPVHRLDRHCSSTDSGRDPEFGRRPPPWCLRSARRSHSDPSAPRTYVDREQLPFLSWRSFSHRPS